MEWRNDPDAAPDGTKSDVLAKLEMGGYCRITDCVKLEGKWQYLDRSGDFVDVDRAVTHWMVIEMPKGTDR